jgi:hypothetical protein
LVPKPTLSAGHKLGRKPGLFDRTIDVQVGRLRSLNCVSISMPVSSG